MSEKFAILHIELQASEEINNETVFFIIVTSNFGLRK